MVDSRFYTPKPRPLGELIAISDQVVEGCDASSEAKLVLGAGSVPFLQEGEIGFAADAAFLSKLSTLSNGIVILGVNAEASVSSADVVVLRTSNPYRVFVDFVSELFPAVSQNQYTLNSLVPDGCGAGTKIGNSTRFGENVTIGDNVVIGANCAIGRGVTIGSDTIVGDNVSIFSSHIGDNCVIHSGARIGNEGFGFLPTSGRPIKIPQLGRVIVQNHVEIGANSCVDRGTLEDTVIGEASKLDNMVQIAHNVEIGRNCQISAQTGIAGSSKIGDNVLLGGRVGLVNKAKMGDNSVAMACALVTKDVPNGEQVAGNPAMRVDKWRKKVAAERIKMRKSK